MKEYTIVFKNGKTEVIECAGKKALISEMFQGDESKFKEKVERLMWDTLATHYVEDIASGEVSAELTSADVNPYGWRKD